MRNLPIIWTSFGGGIISKIHHVRNVGVIYDAEKMQMMDMERDAECYHGVCMQIAGSANSPGNHFTPMGLVYTGGNVSLLRHQEAFIKSPTSTANQPILL